MRSSRMRQLCWLMIGGFIFAGSSFAATSIERFDVAERRVPVEFESVICERTIQNDDFMRIGWFDAQIAVMKLTPKNPSAKLSREQVRNHVKAWADDQEQLSFSYGICQDGSAWGVGYPGPVAVTVAAGVLTIPAKASNVCIQKTLKVSFVPEMVGRSMVVPSSKNMEWRLPHMKGYASVSCVHRNWPNSGAREWALIPLNGAQADSHGIFTLPQDSPEESLLEWVNARRRQMNLPSVARHDALAEAAKNSLGQLSIRHDQRALVSMSKVLRLKNVEPKGENRVSGSTLSEVAGLLWMSPSHRDLLVDPTAEYIGCAVRKTAEGYFAVIMTGEKANGPLAHLK